MRLCDLSPGVPTLTAEYVREFARPATRRDRNARLDGRGVPAGGSGVRHPQGMQAIQAQQAVVKAVGGAAVGVPGIPARGSPI